MRRLLAALGALLLIAARAPDAPVIHTEDVTSFYRLYLQTSGHPTAEQLQKDYLDPGSAGLHRLASLRTVTGQLAIADAAWLVIRPCMPTRADAWLCWPRVRGRLVVAFGKLRRPLSRRRSSRR